MDPMTNPDILMMDQPPIVRNVNTAPMREMDEIQKVAQELRQKDEEDYFKRSEEARKRVDNHLNQNGGDLSLLIRHGIPIDMRCVQLTNWGSNDDYIKTARVPIALPMKNEVLIRSYACGVLFHDLLVRQGILDSWVRSLKLPFTLGSEVAGEVIGVGRNVTGLKPGDRVMCLPERKAWAEYVACKEEHCFRIPDEMTYDEAVALTVDGMVSYALLFEVGGLKVDDPCGLSASRKNVLMHSSAGGLSDMVMQMLRNVPGSRLFKIVLPQEEGVGETLDEMVHFIDRDADYVSEVRHVSPHGVDLVLDCQYEDNFNRDFNLLRPMGKYVLFGTHAAFNEGHGGFLETAKSWWGTDKISPLKLYEENKSICGFNLRNLLYFQHDRQYVKDLFCKVCLLWKNGQIKPHIDSVLKFEEFPEALHRMQEHSNQVGKIIMIPQLTTEDQTLPKKDYFALAEKIVTERRQREEAEKNSLRNKFRLPGAGDLVEDISPEERAREELERRKRQLEEQQQRLREQREQLLQQPVTIPATASLGPTIQPVIQPQPVFAQTQPQLITQAQPMVATTTIPVQVAAAQPPEVEVRTTTGYTEPPIVYDSSTGKTVYNQQKVETETVTAVPVATAPVAAAATPVQSVQQVFTPVSTPVAMETVVTEAVPAVAVETVPAVPMATATTIEEESRPVLTREKVELSVPMSKEEAKALIKEAPAQITEPEKHGGIYEKLREILSHRGE